MAGVKTAGPRIIGQIAASAAANYAEKWGGSPGGQFSRTYGESWTWQQYAAALAATAIGSKLLGKWVNPASFVTGALDLIIGKAVYTEAFAKVPQLSKYLGETGDYDAQYDPRSGQGWLNVDGNYEAMQGLVEATALGTLVEPGYGEITSARALDGVNWSSNQNSDKYSY